MPQAINWYPGHMAKTLREIEEQIKTVDLVVETADARIPSASRNPELQKLVSHKPHILVLCKSDLADPEVTRLWIESAGKVTGQGALACDTQKPRDIKAVAELIAELAAPAVDRQVARGLKGRWPKAMVIGIPNTGKSTLINQLTGGNRAKTENKPGVTRSISWVRSAEHKLELLDTPGVLWANLGAEQQRIHLAATGAIKDSVLDLEEVAYKSFLELLGLYPDMMRERYKLTEEDLEQLEQDPWLVYEAAARHMGCIRSGGKVDSERFANFYLSDLRSGRIGRISLERPS